MGEIVPFKQSKESATALSVPQDLESAIGDITIDDKIVRTRYDRHQFLRSFVEEGLQKTTYLIEQNLQRLGKTLPFTHTGSYDQPYIILDITNGFYPLSERSIVFDTMLDMTKDTYKDEQDFNSLTESLIFYGLTNKSFGEIQEFPFYMKRIIACHRFTPAVTQAIANTFPLTEHKLFKDLNAYITDEYSTAPRRV